MPPRLNLLLAGLGVLVSLPLAAQSPSKPESAVSSTATGTFDVKVIPLTDDAAIGDSTLGRMSINKQFHGELEGTSKGQMLTGMTATKGSAGYVAIERVTGTLKGRHGSFVLMHTGMMDRGAPSLTIVIVPDSGTEELTGIAGSLKIIIEGGKHSYELSYTLPASS